MICALWLAPLPEASSTRDDRFSTCRTWASYKFRRAKFISRSMSRQRLRTGAGNYRLAHPSARASGFLAEGSRAKAREARDGGMPVTPKAYRRSRHRTNAPPFGGEFLLNIRASLETRSPISHRALSQRWYRAGMPLAAAARQRAGVVPWFLRPLSAPSLHPRDDKFREAKCMGS